MSTKWVRMEWTNSYFHIPNKNKRRALCYALLPAENEREVVESPRLWERCVACERERKRRVDGL